jgi:hypothetical protein
MIYIPIEIVNKILVYIGEINNNMIITQYQLNTYNEYYKINFDTDLLWNIKSTLKMKQYYPLYECNFSKYNIRELYKNGKSYYEKQLRDNMIE